jgi:hypothetical protein
VSAQETAHAGLPALPLQARFEPAQRFIPTVRRFSR